MSESPKRPGTLSRRRFVAVVAAGSAAVLARPAAAAVAAARPVRKAAAAPTLSVVQRKEYERQRLATLDTLKTIRGHAMPPGTELASIFRVRRPAKKAR